MNLSSVPRSQRFSEETLEKRHNFRDWLLGKLSVVRWSRAELSRRSGVHPKTISSYIAGASTISDYNYERISQAFEMVGV